MDFSFLDIHQYGSGAVVEGCETFSQLLDEFYRERDQQERMRGAGGGPAAAPL